MKLRKLLIFSVIFITTSTGLIGIFSVYFISQKIIKNQTVKTQHREIARYMNTINQSLTEIANDIKLMSAQSVNYDFRTVNGLEKNLVKHRNISKRFTAISVYLENGVKILDTDRSGVGLKSSADFIKKALYSKRVVLSYKSNEKSDFSSVFFSNAIRDKNGLKAVIVGSVPVSEIVDPSDPVFFINDNSAEVFLLRDTDNKTIFSNSPLTSPFNPQDFKQEVNPRTKDSFFIYENSEYLSFYKLMDMIDADIDGDNWLIYIKQQKSLLFSLINKIMLSITGIFLVLILVSASSMYLISSRVVKNLENITVRLKEMGKGNFEAFNSAKISDINELSEMENEISQMSQELKQTITQLNQRSKLETIGTLSGEIAHEINNPLAIIAGLCELLLFKTRNNKINAQEFEQHFTKMKLTVMRIAEITKGMSTLARSDFNDPFSHSTLKKIQKNVYDICGQGLMQKNISLFFSNESDYLDIECRPNQVVQALVNLVANACDAVVELKDDRWIKIEFESVKDKVLIAVSNGGPKISQDMSKNFFQPFYTTKKIGSGAGMGLPLSQRIVENHNGKIYFDFNQQFTCVVIELPVSQGQALQNVA